PAPRPARCRGRCTGWARRTRQSGRTSGTSSRSSARCRARGSRWRRSRFRRPRASASWSRCRKRRSMTPAVLTEFLLNGLVLGALYVLMALGLSIIFGMVGVAGALALGSLTYSKYRSFILLAVVLLIVGLVLFLQKTAIGTIVRAGSRDPMMVRLLGISLTPVLTLVFGLGVALAALAGVLSAPLAGVQPAMGVNVGTAAFVVVTIGGLGRLAGGVESGLLVGRGGSLRTCCRPRAAEASMYVLMAVILLLRPRGLMGERWEKFD